MLVPVCTLQHFALTFLTKNCHSATLCSYFSYKELSNSLQHVLLLIELNEAVD
jgi:hypothetical protein